MAKILLSLGAAHNTPSVIKSTRGGTVTAVDASYIYVLTKDGKHLAPLKAIEKPAKWMVGEKITAVTHKGELSVTLGYSAEKPAVPSLSTANKSGSSKPPRSHGF